MTVTVKLCTIPPIVQIVSMNLRWIMILLIIAQIADKLWIGAVKMENKTELKPCPFCGGKARLRKESHREYAATYSVTCQDCFVKTRSYSFDDKAIDTWNRRTDK